MHVFDDILEKDVIPYIPFAKAQSMSNLVNQFLTFSLLFSDESATHVRRHIV